MQPLLKTPSQIIDTAHVKGRKEETCFKKRRHLCTLKGKENLKGKKHGRDKNMCPPLLQFPWESTVKIDIFVNVWNELFSAVFFLPEFNVSLTLENEGRI